MAFLKNSFRIISLFLKKELLEEFTYKRVRVHRVN